MSPSTPAIHQMSVSAAHGDAIGNELLQIRDGLRRAGHDSEIFVELVHPSMVREVRPFREYLEISDPDNVVILHYSLGSKIARLARELPDRLVIVYHNITPARWFEPYDRGTARSCRQGREELATLAPRCSLALGDSEYNRQELEELGFSPTGVLPLIMDLGQLDIPPDPSVMARFDDDRTTLLFVGRLVPNKRVEDILRTYAYLRRYVDRRSRLVVVGDTEAVRGYTHALLRLADRLDLDDVHFTGHVPQPELVAYYRAADCFVCMSEHEGFCVPIFEAIHLGLPVVAYEAAAVPYSTDRGVLLLQDKEPAATAELIQAILEDDGLRRRLLERQRRALERLDRETLLERLFEHLRAIGVGNRGGGDPGVGD